jgi:hypothetical protein
MTAANIVPLARPESNESPDAVAELAAERERIAAELSCLAAAVDGPRIAAEAALAKIDGELAALNDADNAAWRAWARDQEGESPTARTEERRALATRRIEALADLDGTKIAVAATAPRLNELNGEIRRLDHLVFAAKLRGAVEEARRFDTEAHERAKAVGEPLAHVISLKMLLASEMMNAAQARGDRAAERLIGEAIGVLNGFTMPELGAEQAALPRQMNAWREALQ